MVRSELAKAVAVMAALASCSAPMAAESGSSGAEDSSGAPDDTGPVGDTGPADDRLLVLPPLSACDPAAPSPGTIRIATWNIGATLFSSFDDVRAVLADVDADVVLVQETEIGAVRTGMIDQPRALADALAVDYAFAAALKWDGGDFGLTVLSRLPFSRARRIALESEETYEPRIALDATVCAGATPVRLVDVHADFVPEANLNNLADIAAEIGAVEAPTVIAGDFNAEPDTEGVKGVLATTGTVDVFAGRDPGPTRLGRRIDFMLATPGLDAAVSSVLRLETEASDHALLAMDVAL
ncbi:MAG: endonuclease/exonuclease/phosphatase family protein [Myxococcota bacterium]